jgi:heparosan-N-sulfate-glucuronate 5-epimerase
MPTLNYYKRIFNAYVINKKKSNLSFWHTPLAVNELDKEDLDNVRKYPQNFIEKTKFEGHKDSNGVIMLNYFGDLGYQYNPNAIAQLGLGFYDLYLNSKREEHKREVITNANWFLKHGRSVKDDVLLWEYDFPFEARQKLKAPWRSALAQGQAISLLLRAYKLSEDECFLDAAHKGYNAFRYEGLKHEGGVICKEAGYTWLEEVIISPPDHILNGFIWALWGVYDYGKFFDNTHAKELFDLCIITLEKYLLCYDLGYWTCYDLIVAPGPKMIVSHYYHHLHIVQMEGCYNITKKSIFHDYVIKWSQYRDSFYCRNRALFEKVYFKLRYF